MNDLLGRTIEKGDEVVLVELRNNPYLVEDAGEIITSGPMGPCRMIKLQQFVMAPLPPAANMFPCFIVKKAQKPGIVN